MVAIDFVVIQRLIGSALTLTFLLLSGGMLSRKLLVLIPQTNLCLNLPLLDPTISFRAHVSVDKLPLNLLATLRILAVLLLFCIFSLCWNSFLLFL